VELVKGVALVCVVDVAVAFGGAAVVVFVVGVLVVSVLDVCVLDVFVVVVVGVLVVVEVVVVVDVVEEDVVVPAMIGTGGGIKPNGGGKALGGGVLGSSSQEEEFGDMLDNWGAICVTRRVARGSMRGGIDGSNVVAFGCAKLTAFVREDPVHRLRTSSAGVGGDGVYEGV
jgi:hypothetical protein